MVETKDKENHKKTNLRLFIIINYLYFLDIEARAEIQKYFRSFLVQIKTIKFASEIY